MEKLRLNYVLPWLLALITPKGFSANLRKNIIQIKLFSFLTVCPTPPDGTYSSVSVTSEDPEVPTIETYWPDTIIKYTCDIGYELKQGSSSTAVCDSEGNWDVTLPPTCHPGMNFHCYCTS